MAVYEKNNKKLQAEIEHLKNEEQKCQSLQKKNIELQQTNEELQRELTNLSTQEEATRKKI